MKNSEIQPVIIIGAARSGTKFIRSVISASKQVNAVDYDISYIWRTGNEQIDHDELMPADASEKSRRHIRKQLQRLAGVKTGDSMMIAEKTVGNTLRVPFVDVIVPEAKYVHLIRDGRAVTESSMRMWQAKPDAGALWKKLREIPLSNISYVVWFAYNFAKGILTGRGGGKVWGPRYRNITSDVENLPLVEICARQWQYCVEKAVAAFNTMPAEKVFTIRYEDLAGNEGEIRRLVEFLGLEDTETVLDWYRENRQGGNDEKWRERMSREDQQRMLEVLHPTLQKLGYIDSKSIKIEQLS